MRPVMVLATVFATAIALLVAAEIHSPSRIVCLKLDEVKTDLATLRQAVNLYRADNGVLPTDLAELVRARFFERLPSDPWRNPYIYRRDASTPGYALYSTGADRMDQSGAGDDIILGDKTYSCEVYGVNCAVPVAERVKCVSLSAAAASLLGLIILASVALRRRWRRH